MKTPNFYKYFLIEITLLILVFALLVANCVHNWSKKNTVLELPTTVKYITINIDKTRLLPIPHHPKYEKAKYYEY